MLGVSRLAGSLSVSGQPEPLHRSRLRIAIALRASYLGIPRPGPGNTAVVAEGDTCMARIRGARGDAFRNRIAASVQNAGQFWEPEAYGKPAAFIPK
jgi:hypothetical protein